MLSNLQPRALLEMKSGVQGDIHWGLFTEGSQYVLWILFLPNGILRVLYSPIDS